MKRLQIESFLLCLCLSVLNTGIHVWENRLLEQQYQRNRDSFLRKGLYQTQYVPYDQGVPLEKIDFQEHAGRIDWLIQTYDVQQLSFCLQHDVAYYAAPEDTEDPVLVRRKGDWVTLYDLYSDKLGGRGIENTYPTYQKGWRYAYPLPLTQGETWEDGGHHSTKLYVRLKDLEQVQTDLLQVNRYEGIFDSVIEFDDRRWDGKPYEKGEKEEILYRETEKLITETFGGGIRTLLKQDRDFYDKGFYFSEDLKEPLWDIWNTIFLLGALGCLFPVIRNYQKRKRDFPKRESA